MQQEKAEHRDRISAIGGGGEMGQLIVAKDWAKTVLGSQEFWPQSLSVSLNIILRSKFPHLLFWGANLICFYNDAFMSTLGANGKHPELLGMPAEKGWAEAWDIIRPWLDRAYTYGEPTFREEEAVPVLRNGRTENTYWTFCYSPVLDESGKPAGVFVTCTEDTKKRKSQQDLLQSKLELEFAIEAAELGTWDYNPVTNKFSANQRLKDWFGLEPNEQIELTHAVNVMLEGDQERVITAIQQALDFSSGGNYDIQYTIIHPGTHVKKIVRAKGRAWFDEQKKAYRFNGIIEDVTDQVLATEKIKQSEQYFRELIDSVPSIIWITGPGGQCSFLSKQWYDYTGQVQVEKQTWGLFDSVFPEDAQVARDLFLKANNERKTFIHGYRQKNKTGDYRWVINNGRPKYSITGEYEGMIGTIVDVHEEKVAAGQIKESEERYHSLIASSPFAIGILKGEDLVITNANQPIIDILGKGWDIMGKPYFEVLPELAEQGYKEVFNTVFRTGSPFNALETPVNILQDGKMQLKYYNFLLYAQKNINGSIDGVGIIASEVTSQALLNAQVRESEKRFRLLADSMPQQVWTADNEGNLNYFNQAVFDYSGLTMEEIKKDGWIQIVHPDDRGKNMELWRNSVQTGNDFIFEHRFRKYTGEYRWQLSRAVAQKDEAGKIQMWVGSSTDIQEQKSFSEQLNEQVQQRTEELTQANKSLQESEQRYHLMVEEVQDYAILYLNRQGIVENWNAGAQKIKGYSAKEIIGRSFSNFYTEEDRNDGLPQKLLGKAAATGRAVQEGWRVRKDGSRFWASVVITAVHNQQNEVIGFSKVTHDLTEKKEAEDKLKKNALELEQKNEDLKKINKELESFAYISSHDLQEPLRKIQTFASWLSSKEYANLSESGRDHFLRMEKAAERMQKLIDDLLAYSRTSSMDRKYVDTDLNEIVEEVKSDLKEELQQKNATINASGLCHLHIIPFQFRQLVQNMVTNSLKFSKPGRDPVITIKSRISGAEEFKNEKLSAKTSYCHISFSDNGIGFDQQYSQRIFELFQRLHGKTEYNGTGIGLAIVKKIVENHNGIITASSQINEGATFDIYLPLQTQGN